MPRPIRPKQAMSNPQEVPDPDVQLSNPSLIETPVYLMNPPLSLDTDNPNNIWMKKLSKAELKVQHKKAFRQWSSLYDRLTGTGLTTYLLQTNMAFQDQVYVANLGITLCHLPKPVVVLAKYKSPPRRGEERVGREFFQEFDYKIVQAPLHWEGEADLKHLRDNIYVGGYGIRTDPKIYDWFEREFGMKVIRVEMKDEWCYHFDCEFFPLTSDTVLACTDMMSKEEVKQIEKVASIEPVSVDLAHAAITNCVRVGSIIICGSTLPEINAKHDDWRDECDKKALLERVLPKYSMSPVLVNMSEFEKSGAAVSCCVMHINRASYATPLL